MKLQLKLTLLLLFVVISTFAQKKALESITENDLKAHLEFIASDYMQGRNFGTEIPGLDITADYIKAMLQKMGLKPANKNYFQLVEMVCVKPDLKNSFFELKEKNGNLLFRSDDILDGLNTSEDETLEGDIVFAGYGWIDENLGYNDFKGLNLKNKIVVIMTRNQETVLDSSKIGWVKNLEFSKYDTIFKLGAQAVIQCMDPLNPDKSFYQVVKDFSTRGIFSLDKDSITFFPGTVLFAEISVINKMLENYYTNLEKLQNELNQLGKPKSFPLEGIKTNIYLPKKVETIIGENVIGIIEGSNPVLKNECVVISAHYDHVGTNSNGEVFNGADDNGSGTVALLEIAEAYTKMKKAPKRSIVFAWVTAEEKGLFGSGFYAQNPVIPLEKTLVDINMDMIGRSAEKEAEKDVDMEKGLCGPNGVYIVSGGQSSELTKISNSICKQLNLVPSDAMTKGFLNRSDYYHFYRNGIPVLGISTGLHEDYHQITDEIEKIDFHKMKRVADYVFLVSNKVANQKKRIVVDKPVEQKE